MLVMLWLLGFGRVAGGHPGMFLFLLNRLLYLSQQRRSGAPYVGPMIVLVEPHLRVNREPILYVMVWR